MAVGVAVPLGVILIAALALLAYREWKRRKLIDELVAQKTHSLNIGGVGGGGAAATDVRFGEVKGYYSHGSPSELSTEGRGGRAELGSTRGPFHEVGVSSPR